MLFSRLRLSGFAVAVLVAVPVSGVVDAEAAPEPLAGPLGDPAGTVTLVTGDQVLLGEHGSVSVGPGAGRRGVRFAMSRIDDHQYVVPSDALTLLGQGRLDRRLFDVTGLLALGLQDSKRSDLPLLVRGRHDVGPLADQAGATVTRRLSGPGTAAVRQPKRSAGAFWLRALRDGRVQTLWLDVTPRSALPPPVGYQEAESYNLTLHVRDSDGMPPSNYLMVVFGVDSGREYWGSETDGSIDLRLPPGRYHMFAFVTETSDTSLLTWPEYQLAGDDTVTFDARTARPHSVKLPERAVRSRGAAVLYSYDYGTNSIGAGIYTTNLSRVRSAQVGPELPRHRMVSSLTGAWDVPDRKGSYLRGPRGYHLAYYGYGYLLNGVTRTLTLDDLAAVRATYHSHGAGKTARKFWYSTPADVDLDWSFGHGLLLSLPLTRTEYLNTDGDAAWHSMVSLIGDNNVYDGELVDRHPRQYRAGVSYRQVWNRAVSGPAFTDWPEDGAFRKGRTIQVSLSTATDGSGHPGRGYRDRGSLRLYQNGTKLGESGRPGSAWFRVPSGAGRFVMTGSATRYGWTYPTKWSSSWTFRAEDTPDWTGLPMLTVSLSPAVDSRNRAYDGKRQWVPVTVRSAATDGRVKLASLTVEVSFNDGVTWKKVRVVRSGHRWLADIYHPSGKRYVSLRTRAVDSDGNSGKQTIIRAYGLI